MLLVYPHFRPYSRWHWLPTSMVFLASPLKAMGYRPILVDDRFSRERTLSLLDDHIGDAVLVGIGTATGSQLANALELATWCKWRKASVPVVFGGPFPSAKPKLTLRSPHVDAVVTGQGEWTLLHLCEAFRPGVTKGKPVNVANLPTLPYGDWRFMAVEDYLNPDTMAVNYATGTGCVGHCGFCYWPEGYKYSRFGATRVLRDLTGLVERHGIRNVQFDDGTFFVGRRRTMEVVEAIAGLGLRWRANARVDTLNAFKLGDWRKIAAAGCHLMHIGLEHASGRILAMMDKRISPAHAVVAIRRAKEAGVGLRFHLLLGNPTETVADLEQLGWWLARMLDEDPGLDYTVNWFTPYPGCAMTKLAKRHGYREPRTLEGFARLELANYLHLPDDDREIAKETSPWEEDYRVPWFTDGENAAYMEAFRRVIPLKGTIETTGGKVERIYADAGEWT